MDTQNAVAVKEMKREATNLAHMLKQEFGCQITHSDALERIARLRDFDNWDTAVACVGRKHSEVMTNILSRRDQFIQIFGFHTAIRNGMTVSNAIKSFKEQFDIEAANGWQCAIFDENSGAPISATLRSTGLFDDDVITIASMVDGYGDWSSSLSSIVDYLKTTMH